VAIVQLGDAVAADVVGLDATHLAERSRRGRLLPGRGDLDLPAFVAAVRATGFRGPVAPEVLSDAVRATAPAVFAAEALAALRATWPRDA
jgi:sugar phosphate isomerase/epimerase